MAARTRTTIRLAAVAVMAATATVGCDGDTVITGGDGVRGSGDIVTEDREVSGFSEVHLEGGGDVIVDVGDTESLTVEADDNLLELITTEVRNSRLVIEFEQSLRPTRTIVYRIGAIEFEGVSIAGGADVTAPNLDCDTFSISIAGAGSFDIGGSCDALDVSIAGSGDVDAGDLVVERADISIAGSGDVTVNATDELEVSIAGSGEVVYLGDPATDLDIQGSGNVRKGP